MASKRRSIAQSASPTWRRAIILVVIVLLGYLLITQVKSLSPSLSIVRHAVPKFVLLGLLATIATFFVAGFMYQILALHDLRYKRTLLIQIASGFTNRLLPAGLGGIGLIAQYLRTQKHSTSEAVAVVGMDTIIGIIGHFWLFLAAVALANMSSTALYLPHLSRISSVLVIIVILLLGIVKRVRNMVSGIAKRIVHDLARYQKQPIRLALAFLTSLLLTIMYVGILWACAHAVGIDLSFPKILVVFTAGSIVGNATPTPGGLIGVEVGLLGGFVAYGFSSGASLAAALLYRLLTYWLPILPGIIAFWVAQKKLDLFS